MKRRYTFITASLAALLASGAQAKVSEEEAARIGTELTANGATIAGNADGTIPAWTGSMTTPPEGYGGSGKPFVDPYADDKVKFSITAENVDQYKDQLSQGTIAMLNKWPSFRVDVYPTHRDGAFSDVYVERVKFNAVNTTMENNGEMVKNWTGATAFPIPKDGMEVMWNARTAIGYPVVYGQYTNIAVFANGARTVEANKVDSVYIFANPETPVGTTEETLGNTLFRSLGENLKPAARKGEMNMIHDPIDYTSAARKAWTYTPGTRRVRQAPNMGFDTPTGPGGLFTVDDNQGFNGAFKKYNWKLIGKQEKIVPFHNYKLNDPSVDYETLLQAGHVNPDYMRWELRRVWVVEATLQEGQRHVYGKRVFYIDEDAQVISAIDNYDNRGNLYRAGYITSIYHYGLPTYVPRHNLFYDLQSGHYLITRLTNDQGPAIYDAEPKDAEFYSPSNLRRQARR